ncbi:MAG: hypothetical protein ACREXS_20530, partial [Gammaproteobacteria bacterium]
KRLNTAYLLKESFGQLWSYEREGWARRFFENWRNALKWQRLKRGNIYLTDAHGEMRAAAEWVGHGGRARTLRGDLSASIHLRCTHPQDRLSILYLSLTAHHD